MRSALLLTALSSLFAQQEATIRVDVRQVLVPVVATNRKGHHVSGLRAGDFRIFEDGVPQVMASFATDASLGVNDLNQTAGAAAAPAGTRRTYVICVDALHTSSAAALRLRDALESLFAKEKAGDAQFVLVSIGPRLKVLQPATSNPLQVLQKVRDPAFQNVMAGTDSSSLNAQLAGLRMRMEDFCKRCPCAVARNTPAGCGGQTDNLKQAVDDEAARWIAPAKALLDQFQSVVEELAKVPTGRTLILISDGFQVDPVRAFYATVSAYLPAAPQFRLPDSSDADRALRAALRTAANRNITIDTVDMRGGTAPSFAGFGTMDAGNSSAAPVQSMTSPLRTAPSVRQTSLNTGVSQQANPLRTTESTTLEQLAHETGGLYSHDGENVANGLRNALADGREYYVLGYVSTNSAPDGRFRHITVETTAKGVNLRTKTGYWAPGSAQ